MGQWSIGWRLGMHAVRTENYYGESWLDGRPSLILDYANSSRLFHNARDELREVAPGLYIGMTYLRTDGPPKLATFFVIQQHFQGHRTFICTASDSMAQ